MFPSEGINSCPMRLVDKYVSLWHLLFQESTRRSLEKPKPFQWYSVQRVGKHILATVVGRMLKDAKLDAFSVNIACKGQLSHIYSK